MFNAKKEENYCYYSKLLQKPFDSIDELKEAESAQRAKLKEKEEKAAIKKAEALVVENAFKAMNAARKAYKEEIDQVTEDYRTNLERLRTAYKDTCVQARNKMTKAEESYYKALKSFTSKYPEGFHMTLKDGDCETTIRHKGEASTVDMLKSSVDFTDLFNLLFK